MFSLLSLIKKPERFNYEKVGTGTCQEVKLDDLDSEQWLMSESQKVKSSLICNPELQSDSSDFFLKENIHLLAKDLC